MGDLDLVLANIFKAKSKERYLYIQIHGSIIHNSQEVEATQVSLNRWMDKQNMVDTFRGVLSSL